MKTWFQTHQKAVIVTLGVFFFFLFFLIIVPNLLRLIINGPWEDFWPHQKTSPEVDASFVNAIIGFLTVGVTVLATYLINRQTIKETAKMNSKTQELMAKQLEVQQQQARSTLRDYVYKQRVEFYIFLINEIREVMSTIFLIEDGDCLEKKESIELSKRLESLSKTIENKYSIASIRLQRVLKEYKDSCNYVGIFTVYTESESLNIIKKYSEFIKEMIYLELNLHQIDQDMDNLLDTSSKKRLEELAKEVE